jgi:ubiquinol-cytochrome c reductase iron-sulfur subunit
MARQAGLDHARTPEQLASLRKTDAQLADPKSERKPYPPPTTPRTKTAPSSPSVCGGGHLHPPGLLARRQVPDRCPALAARRLAGRLPLPCHGSTFDMAGRVFKNKPAPDNLEVPPHMYLSDTKLLIGEDKKA